MGFSAPTTLHGAAPSERPRGRTREESRDSIGYFYLRSTPRRGAFALTSLRRVPKPGGFLVSPTYLHRVTFGVSMLSRLFALTGVPGQRRFTLQSLRVGLGRILKACHARRLRSQRAWSRSHRPDRVVVQHPYVLRR